MNTIWQAYDDFNHIAAEATGHERLPVSLFASVSEVDQH